MIVLAQLKVTELLLLLFLLLFTDIYIWTCRKWMKCLKKRNLNIQVILPKQTVLELINIWFCSEWYLCCSFIYFHHIPFPQIFYMQDFLNCFLLLHVMNWAVSHWGIFFFFLHILTSCTVHSGVPQHAGKYFPISEGVSPMSLVSHFYISVEGAL